MTGSPEKDNVSAALGELNQTIEDEKERLNAEVADAMKNGEYDAATAVIQFSKSLLAFQIEVEALIEKWEDLEEIGSAHFGQFENNGHVRPSKPSVSNPPASGNDQTSEHCFHILDVIVEMGGIAKNQDVTAAVNKRIKMLYPRFKEAKSMMAQEGWTKNNRSIHILEISPSGTEWLRRQKSRFTAVSQGDQSYQKTQFEKAIQPTQEPVPENRAQKSDVPMTAEGDFDQI